MCVSGSGVTSIISGVGGRAVEVVRSRSCPPVGQYGVDITGLACWRTVDGKPSRSRPPIGWCGVDIAGLIPGCRGGPGLS